MRTDSDFTDSTLAQASVCYNVTLFIRLELFDRVYSALVAQLVVLTLSFIHPPVCAGGYKA